MHQINKFYRSLSSIAQLFIYNSRQSNETITKRYTYMCNRFCSTNAATATYKAAVLKKYGQSLEMVEKKREALGKDQVRIAVYACGVNASDLMMFEDKYDHQKSLPFVPGFEICGEVIELGEEVKTLAIGQRIIGLNKADLGGFAEECIAIEKDLWPVDLSMPFETGASLTENYATALLGLHRRAQVGSSSTVLVTAAAGGLGLAAVDLAANVYKAKVIGVCGTNDKADLVRQKGAWAALKYNKTHMEKKVMEVTEGNGIDVVFDAVGGEIFESALQCVGNEGRVIVAGFASRVIPHVKTNLLLPKAIAVMGLSLSSYRDFNNPVYRQAVEDSIDLYKMGLINPHISAEFPLENTDEAFNYIRERKSTGKVVLQIR